MGILKEKSLDLGKWLMIKECREEGNERYEYFFPMDDSKTVMLVDKWKNQEALDLHHKSELMQEIADLRNKYKLKMRVEKLTEWEEK